MIDVTAIPWRTGRVLSVDGTLAECLCDCGEKFRTTRNALRMRRSEGRLTLRCSRCATTVSARRFNKRHLPNYGASATQGVRRV